MIHDYYLKDMNNLIDYVTWKNRKNNKLKNKSETEKYQEWINDIFSIPLAKNKEEIHNNIKSNDVSAFLPNDYDRAKLPANSTLIKINFTLKKPYASKDEGFFKLIHLFTLDKTIKNHLNNNNNQQLQNVFRNNNHNLPRKYDVSKKDDYWIIQIKGETEYILIEDEKNLKIYDGRICENPIVRDKFTGLPLVKPSTWKGHLRYAAGMVDDAEIENKEKIIQRLFGSYPGDDNAVKGRLYFYPTFFENEPKKDVITPLKRDTRTPSKGPISLEIMDKGANGDFHILYFPYPKGEDYDEKQVEEDLNLLAKSLKLMFYLYGFSAKKTSGFGVIEKLKEDTVEIKPDKNKGIFDGLWKENTDSGRGVD